MGNILCGNPHWIVFTSKLPDTAAEPVFLTVHQGCKVRARPKFMGNESSARYTAELTSQE